MQCLPPQWHASLPSTNTYLLEQLRAGRPLPAGTVVAAREQTAGRGRLGNRWISVPGRDLTFSVLLRDVPGPRQRLAAPMAAALGVAVALAQHDDLTVRLKWPNDLLAGGRKLGGVLTECDGEALVIGIGLNVNMPAEVAAQLDQPATSVAIQTGRQAVPEEVLAALLEPLSAWLTTWQQGGFAALRAAWTDRAAYLGLPVRVGEVGRGVEGRLAGFGGWGQALLAQADGTLLEAFSGHLRPL